MLDDADNMFEEQLSRKIDSIIAELEKQIEEEEEKRRHGEEDFKEEK